jgi:hypothetical protein
LFGKNILSLSIAGTTVKALSARGDSVERWDSVPFPANFIKKGCVADPVALGGLLKDALAERKLNKGKVVCALSAVGATSRVFNLPKVDAHQLETIISREARRLSDNSVEKSFVHWRTLPSSDGQLLVYLLIVPKRPLHALVKTIKSAGLKASLIDLKSMALMRAVNRRNAIIANGEENCVDMTIVRHDLPMVIRSVFFGNGMPSSDQAANRIADEVMQTLSAYAGSHRDKPLPQQVPVFLTGAAAGGAAAVLNVTTLTGHPIANIQPPLRYPDDLPLAEYAVNMGLILRML